MNQAMLAEMEEMIEKEYVNLTGVLVEKDGRRVYEHYWRGMTKNNPIHVYSVTKSIFSALFGIAMGDGLIKSVDQKVLDFFPEYDMKVEDEVLKQITLKHLLTMTATYRTEKEPYEEFFSSPSWLIFAIGYLGGKELTGEFRYSPIIGPHVLSGVLSKVIGGSILEYANQKLFGPLGIDVKDSLIFRSAEEQMAWYGEPKKKKCWVADVEGINTASWGLVLTQDDIAKIGRLYLNGGVWNGKQIVPVEWIRESTSHKVDFQNMGYGYLWWIVDDKKRIYAGIGDGGNVLYVNEGKNLVVVITGFFMPSIENKDRIQFIQEVIEKVIEE